MRGNTFNSKHTLTPLNTKFGGNTYTKVRGNSLNSKHTLTPLSTTFRGNTYAKVIRNTTGVPVDESHVIHLPVA
jgi:hypothetical protein